MTSASYRFDRFVVDSSDRRLLCDGAPVELNGRYFDALTLLVAEAGRLVSKDRFHQEVWRGIPVTDEALTQCIRTLRRQLGDDAANPRFIETVPKHGYRFIGEVEAAGDARAETRPGGALATGGFPLSRLLVLGAAGTAGGGFAGALGGLAYGFAGAAEPLAPGVGAASVLLVVLFIAVAVALVGAAGVAFGIAVGGFGQAKRSPWIVAGGAAGGTLVGAVVKLVGLDAFALLVGQSPGDITGAAEGLVLGAAVGLGAWLSSASTSLRRNVIAAGLAGMAAGAAIPLFGGRMMAGSLDAMARSFPDSRLRLDPIGNLFGEGGFGPISQSVTGGLEGLLFGACVVGAMLLARRVLDRG